MSPYFFQLGKGKHACLVKPDEQVLAVHLVLVLAALDADICITGF